MTRNIVECLKHMHSMCAKHTKTVNVRDYNNISLKRVFLNWIYATAENTNKNLATCI